MALPDVSGYDGAERSLVDSESLSYIFFFDLLGTFFPQSKLYCFF